MITYEKQEVYDIFSTQIIFQFFEKRWEEMGDTFKFTLQVCTTFYFHWPLNQADAIY